MRNMRVAMLILGLLMALVTLGSVNAQEKFPDSTMYLYSDASSQFNEQGYFLGSSFSNLGNASINNFNGNLMYQKRLYNIPGPNGLDLNIALTYNGSTPHSLVSSLRWGVAHVIPPKIGINAPEWILSVNNIGILVFNFENDLISWVKSGPAYDSALYHDSVVVLVNGYHFNVNRIASNPNPLVLSLLLGDGSSTNIYDTAFAPEGKPDYGLGQSLGKDEYYKFWSGRMACDSLDTSERCNWYTIKTGDGNTIYGELYKVSFLHGYHEKNPDNSQGDVEEYDTIKVFIPEIIYDNAGNKITFEYQKSHNGSTICGRPLLKKISLNDDPRMTIDIEYHFTGSSIDYVTVGDYKLDIRSRPGTGSYPSLFGAENRGYVTKITDPAGRETNIEYERYVRGFTNWVNFNGFKYNQYGQIDSMSAHEVFPAFYRISEIKEYSGGKYKFKYYCSYQQTDSLKIYLDLDNIDYYCEPAIRYAAYFDNLGRDPFFNNMVTSMAKYNCYTGNEDLIVKDSLIFHWTYPNDDKCYAFGSFFFTNKYTDSVSNPVTNGDHTKYVYKMIPYSLYRRDVNNYIGSWNTFLYIFDSDLDSALFDFSYDSAGPAPPNGPGFIGTLKTKQKDYTIGGKTFKETYDYTLASDSLNISEATTINGVRGKSVTEYDGTYLTVSDSTSLYINNNVKSNTNYICIDSVTDSMIAKTGYSYYSTGSNYGYPGQLKDITRYLVEDSCVEDSFKTTYTYHKTEFEGAGNLKKVIDPMNNSLQLFYGLTTNYTDSSPYNIEYYLRTQVDDSIPVKDMFSNFKARFSKLEKYNDNDTLRMYRSYNKYGAVTRNVNYNKQVTYYDYDELSRIKEITSPYSFEDDATTVSDSAIFIVLNDAVRRDSAHIVYENKMCSDTVLENSLDDNKWMTPMLGFPDVSTLISGPEIVLDSAFLRFYVQSLDIDLDSISIYVYKDTSSPVLWDECDYSGAVYPDVISCDAKLPDNYLGITNIDITDYVKALIGADETSSFTLYPTVYPISNSRTLYINSREAEGASKRPSIVVYYTFNDYEGYTIKYDYDDTTSDSTSVTVTTTKSIIPDSIDVRTRLYCDGFLRSFRSDLYETALSYDSILSIYDFRNQVEQSIDQLGYSTDRKYDRLSRLVRTTYPDDSLTIYDSVAFGAIWVSDLPDSIESYINMPDSFLTYKTIIDEDGKASVSYLDGVGQQRLVLDTLDGESLWTIFQYDYLGNQILVRRPNGDSVYYEYNSLGQFVKQWSADYDTVFYKYDDKGRLIAVRDGNMTDMDNDTLIYWRYSTYDHLDRITESGYLILNTGAGEDSIYTSIDHYLYDLDTNSNSAGKLSLEWSNYDGYRYAQNYDYDARGCLIEQTNFYNFSRELSDDSCIFFRTASVTAGNPGDYYADTMPSFRFPQKIVYTLTYNSTSEADTNNYCKIVHVGHSTKMISPPPSDDTYIDSFYVGTSDSVIISVYRSGVDSASMGEYTASYVYMAADLCDTIETRYKEKYTFKYKYNSADMLTQVEYPDSLKITYDYDQRGRLTAVGDTADADQYSRLSYTKRDEVKQKIVGDTTQIQDYEYNARGWLTAINDTLDQYHKFRQTLDYYGDGYYKNGNIRSNLMEFDNDSSTYYEYTYDGLDRLIGASHNVLSAYPIEGFSYDKNGNFDTVKYYDRDAYNYFTDTLVYEHIDGTNQLERLSNNEINKFTYDANGNLKTDSTKNATYYYSYLNRLDDVVVPTRWGNEHVYFGYNHDGLRVYKGNVWTYRDTCGQVNPLKSIGDPDELNKLEDIDNSTITGETDLLNGVSIEGINPPVALCTYWDTTFTAYLRSFGKTLKEVDHNGFNPTWYIYAGEDRIATIDENGNLYYYIKDHLGSTRMTIHENGTVYGRYYRYFAYGETESEQVTLNQPHKYTGKPLDTDKGLNIYYYGARYYNPHLGRWLAVDPQHRKYPSLSPYAFVKNNPIKYIDRWGLEPDSSDKSDGNVSIAEIEHFIESVLAPYVTSGAMITIGGIMTATCLAAVPAAGSTGAGIIAEPVLFICIGAGIYMVVVGVNIFIVHTSNVTGLDIPSLQDDDFFKKMIPPWPRDKDKDNDNDDDDNDNNNDDHDKNDDGADNKDLRQNIDKNILFDMIY